MKILLLDNWGEKAKRMLGEYLLKTKTMTELMILHENRYYGVVGIIAGLENRIDKEIIDCCCDLNFVASCTTGLDHIDTDYCKTKDIKVISLQGERDFLNSVWATAEHTWALIMSLVRKVPFAHNDVCRGNWDREAWQGMELRGKTLGIVGYGRVGQQVAHFAKAFGMNVLAYDTNHRGRVNNCPDEDYYTDFIAIKRKSFECFLQDSDIITVHVPLNDETRGMFGAKQFTMTKPTAYFINTSRGAVVDEEALLRTLKAKQIKGAALDVLSDEGMYSGFANHKLRDYAQLYDEYNLIITPHIAGNTAESRESTQLFIANKIKEFIQGGG